MMPRRYGEQSRVAFLPPEKICMAVALIFFALSFVTFFVADAVHRSGAYKWIDIEAMAEFWGNWLLACWGLCFLFIALALLFLKYTPERVAIRQMLRYRLFAKAGGNPLGLKNESAIPSLDVKDDGEGRYRVVIDTSACSADTLVKLPKIISSGLIDDYAGWAIVAVDEDPASSFVSYIIEDVTRSRKIIAETPWEIYSDHVTQMVIQEGFFLDLTKSGSILICGKTRSGKTTAVESILIQLLAHGPDAYGSKVLILDPKGAELSRLPYTLSPDEEGSAKGMLQALRDFEQTRRTRQKVLDDLSEQHGRPVMWWEAGMHPSVLFVDEWVAFQALMPKKAPKDDPDYSLQSLQDMVKILVTMGASAGCYVILSTAEASVESAGVPSMIRSAMGTKILMRPTKQEGMLLWSTDKMDALPERRYAQGDAWISSTDGIHDNPSFVQFPKMEFPEFEVLRALLHRYYD